jgi:6-hydroxy-3-succinoylpyridine 3-monooxygenase
MLFGSRILPSIGYIPAGHKTVPGVELLTDAGVKYFTATIMEKAAKAADSVSSQMIYHSALRAHLGSQIEVIKGYYSLTAVTQRSVDQSDPRRWPRDCQKVLVWKLEEKQTDVNIALQLYDDAIQGSVDQVVVVSNDTDIAPALQLIRKRTDVVIGLVVPAPNPRERGVLRQPNTDLSGVAHWTRGFIDEQDLRAAQLPRSVEGKRKAITKPESWYGRPDLLAKVIDAALPVCKTRSAFFKWAVTRNLYLGNQAPLDLLLTDEGANDVLQYIAKYASDKG